MRAARLPGGATTSALGFGCAYLAGGFEARGNAALVRTAFDAGIRHFDTAPVYGLGAAEDVLAAALRGHRQEVTLATKAGLARARTSALVSFARAGLRPLRNAVRTYRRRRAAGTAVPGTAAGASPARPRGDFRPESIAASIEESLRRLQTDYVDLFLLHEVQRADLTDELLALLQRLRRQGQCRALGLATEPADIEAIARDFPDFFEVHQCRWSVLDWREPLPAGAALLVTHRALLRAFAPLQHWLAMDASARARLSERCGRNAGDPAVLSQLLLGAALSAHPGGLVLMSSQRSERVRENARVAGDEAMIAAGARFAAALREEPGCPAPAS